MKKIILFSIFALFTILISNKNSKAESYFLNETAVDAAFGAAQTIDVLTYASNITNLLTNHAGAQLAEDKKVLTGILAILCGGFGVHRFMMHHNKAGFVYLGYTLCSGIVISVIATLTLGIGGILFPLSALAMVEGVVDGIMYLTADDFSKYENNAKIIQWLNK